MEVAGRFAGAQADGPDVVHDLGKGRGDIPVQQGEDRIQVGSGQDGATAGGEGDSDTVEDAEDGLLAVGGVIVAEGVIAFCLISGVPPATALIGGCLAFVASVGSWIALT